MSDTATAWDFQVSKGDLHKSEIVPSATTADVALKDGDILVKVERFAFTSNNITYAAFGEAMKYWTFFPAPDGWGRIPVWGYAQVVQSKHPDVNVGERLFGYFPMSSYLKIEASRVKPDALVDASAHRAGLAPAYNKYVRLPAASALDVRNEDNTAVLWPLLITSFLIDDFLDEKAFFGAKRVILSSASSKTSLGLAWALAKRKAQGIKVVGLTSAASRDFVMSTGWYDEVLSYDDIEKATLDDALFVDMAGSIETRARIHHHFGDKLKFSLVVGGTHWDEGVRASDLPGPHPEFFFAPDRIVKRNQDWGREEFDARTQGALKEFVAAASGWFSIEEKRGQADIAKAYEAVLNGKCPPDKGYIFVM